MERRHFKCYACQKNNNFYFETKYIGNCCKYCGTYNYYINKKKQNNFFMMVSSIEKNFQFLYLIPRYLL